MLAQERTIHPAASLIDLYKLYIQSVFGPGHMITDQTLARQQLEQEIDHFQPYLQVDPQHPEQLCSCLFVDCSVISPLARYSVELVVNQTVSFDDYFSAFIQTANKITKVNLDFYFELWQKILLELVGWQIENFQIDKIYLKKIMANKKYLISHTPKYHQHYHPSYRVISKNFISWEN